MEFCKSVRKIRKAPNDNTNGSARPSRPMAFLSVKYENTRDVSLSVSLGMGLLSSVLLWRKDAARPMADYRAGLQGGHIQIRKPALSFRPSSRRSIRGRLTLVHR